MRRNSAPADPDLNALRARATNLRRHMLTMARGQGQGYIGQGRGIADVLAALGRPHVFGAAPGRRGGRSRHSEGTTRTSEAR